MAPLGLSAAEIRAKAGALRGTVDARNNREGVAAAVVGVFFAYIAITGDGAGRARWRRAHGRRHRVRRLVHPGPRRAAALPGEGLACAAFYRRELVRQRDLLARGVALVPRPLVPGMAVLLIGGLVRSGFALGGVLAAVFVLVVFGGVGLIIGWWRGS